MKRFVFSAFLASACFVLMPDVTLAQSPSNGNDWAKAYYYYSGYNPWYWHYYGHYQQNYQSIEQREWTQKQQMLFPNAPYDYYGWTMPGSAYNNPYSLYGAAAGVPTLYNPKYVVGSYDFRVVPYRSPNYYAPTQYDYVPVPKR
jgi:hypothetical protein